MARNSGAARQRVGRALYAESLHPLHGTPAAPEREAPDLQAYVRRIDRYTYGLGWLLCEIDHQTVGFCTSARTPAAPEDLFTVEFQLSSCRGCAAGISARPVGADAGHAGDGQPPAGGVAASTGENQAGPGVFPGHGLCAPGGGAPRGAGKAVACLSPAPLGPGRSQAHQALPGGGGRLRGCPGKRPPRWWMFLGWNKGRPAALAAGFFAPVPSCQGEKKL